MTRRGRAPRRLGHADQQHHRHAESMAARVKAGEAPAHPTARREGGYDAYATLRASSSPHCGRQRSGGTRAGHERGCRHAVDTVPVARRSR